MALKGKGFDRATHLLRRLEREEMTGTRDLQIFRTLDPGYDLRGHNPGRNDRIIAACQDENRAIDPIHA